MTIPPWLTPRDPATEYLKGVSIGSQMGEQQQSAQLRAQQIAQAQAKLQQDAALAEMEIKVKQDIEQNRALREQQKLQIESSYNQERIQLEQQRVQETAAKTELAQQIAQRRFQAQQQYQAMLKGGTDPAQALMQMGPAMGVPMTGLAQAMKASRPPVPAPPPQVLDVGGEKILRTVQPDGKVTDRPFKTAPEGKMSDQDKAQVRQLEREMKQVEGNELWKLGTLAGSSKLKPDQRTVYEGLVKRHQDLQSQIDKLTGVKTGTKEPGSPHPEGSYLHGPDGLYVVRNGQPVKWTPPEEQSTESEGDATLSSPTTM